jgi:hypothetical protein
MHRPDDDTPLRARRRPGVVLWLAALWCLAPRLALAQDDSALAEALRASTALLRTRGQMMGVDDVGFRTLGLSAEPMNAACTEPLGPPRHGVAAVEGAFRLLLDNPSPTATTVALVAHEGAARSVLDARTLPPGRTSWGCLRLDGSGVSTLHAIELRNGVDATPLDGFVPLLNLSREVAAVEAAEALRVGTPRSGLLLRAGAAPAAPSLEAAITEALRLDYPPGAAVLLYTPTERGWHALAVRADGQVARADIPSAPATAPVVATAEGATSRGLRVVTAPELPAELSDRLFPPALDPVLDGATLLVIVPDGELATVPFPALRRRGRALVETTAVAIAPHVGAFLSPPPAWNGAAFQRPLVVGDPTTPDHPPLPEARAEATTVGTRLGASPLLGAEATLGRVVAAAPDADLLYLAAHGVASASQPLDESYIALAGHERWTARAIKTQTLSARLAVLSACSTGEGMAVDGGVIGLARAFQIAGVPRVVMSLWPVDDAATAALMAAFVRHLADVPPSEALRRAMLERRAVDPDPRHWAAFTVFGSGR